MLHHSGICRAKNKGGASTRNKGARAPLLHSYATALLTVQKQKSEMSFLRL